MSFYVKIESYCPAFNIVTAVHIPESTEKEKLVSALLRKDIPLNDFGIDATWRNIEWMSDLKIELDKLSLTSLKVLHQALMPIFSEYVNNEDRAKVLWYFQLLSEDECVKLGNQIQSLLPGKYNGNDLVIIVDTLVNIKSPSYRDRVIQCVYQLSDWDTESFEILKLVEHVSDNLDACEKISTFDEKSEFLNTFREQIQKFLHKKSSEASAILGRQVRYLIPAITADRVSSVIHILYHIRDTARPKLIHIAAQLFTWDMSTDNRIKILNYLQEHHEVLSTIESLPKEEKAEVAQYIIAPRETAHLDILYFLKLNETKS